MRRIWLWGVGKYLEKVKDVVVDEKKLQELLIILLNYKGRLFSRYRCIILRI